MPKLPWMQFYPSDWLLDTQLLTPQARGLWVDIICHMWRSESRGVLSCNTTDMAQLLRCTGQQLSSALDEFKQRNICTIERVNDTVTLRCRRICREEKSRSSTKLRVARHRSNGHVTPPSNASVTKLVTGESHISESEVISQKQKKSKPLRAVLNDDAWLSELKMNPAYRHIDFERENGKMDVWLALPANRNRIKTRRFILKWLNNVEKPVQITKPVDDGPYHKKVCL